MALPLICCDLRQVIVTLQACFLICKANRLDSVFKGPFKGVPKKNICKIPQRDRPALTNSFLSPLLSVDTAHIPCGGEDWPCSLGHGQGKAGACCASGWRPREALSREPSWDYSSSSVTEELFPRTR